MTKYNVWSLNFNLQDKAYLVKKLSLQLKHMEKKLNVRKGKPTAQITQNYFRMLTKEQVVGLYRAYQPDFELFDYSIEPYLSWSKAN